VFRIHKINVRESKQVSVSADSGARYKMHVSADSGGRYMMHVSADSGWRHTIHIGPNQRVSQHKNVTVIR
jgi:hypothetical protein